MAAVSETIHDINLTEVTPILFEGGELFDLRGANPSGTWEVLLYTRTYPDQDFSQSKTLVISVSRVKQRSMEEYITCAETELDRLDPNTSKVFATNFQLVSLSEEQLIQQGFA